MAFSSAVIVLSVSAVAAYFTAVRLLESEQWLLHSYQVKAALGEIDSAVLRAGRACRGYTLTANQDLEREFDTAAVQVPQTLARLRELTRDNPKQQEFCSDLEKAVNGRVLLLRESIALKKRAPEDNAGQDEIARRALPLSSDLTSTMGRMQDEEQRLLAIRASTSRRWFNFAVIVLTAAFIAALLLFSVHYRLLSQELDAREQAEHAVRASEESLRRLTGRLLQLQDEERRKFSRELHDSLGQYLAGVKMNLDMFSRSQPSHRLLSEAISLLDQSIAETRTISHLLHPPLLDEAGFASAAKWYLDGFAQRSGIAVAANLPDTIHRLPRPVELGLFRVLQESLTNIHRHSGSSKASVALQLTDHEVVLTVRDYGKGLSPKLLQSFPANGANTGVGLAGMRERVRELGGQLQVESGAFGTLISAIIPLGEAPKVPELTAANTQLGK